MLTYHCCCFTQHSTQHNCRFSHLELTAMFTLHLCAAEFGLYAGRVRFESENPTQNSALLIPSTEESDEGRYTCHISAFPNGNFERHITLAVWSKSPSHLSSIALFLSSLPNLPNTTRAAALTFKLSHLP